jgi:glycine C-acetyltransferase
MPLDRVENALAADLDERRERGLLKGAEAVVTAVVPPADGRGPRYRLAGHGDRPFLKMNSNGYLGLSGRREVIAAEEEAARAFGAGPGAVRFISGTYQSHVDLEARLAAFHRREAAMLFSSAYATVVGTLVPLTTADTAIVSDALNHNCIINGMRLARPQEKYVYRHLDMADLEARLGEAAAAGARRAIVVTDGVFSMRGDWAPMPEVVALARRWDDRFPENVLVMMDDSHGVGAFGPTGRGTEEATGTSGVDLLVATLGKALGVNGGYVATSARVVEFLRESSPFYVYSNPITPAEAAAADRALSILDGQEGLRLLGHLRAMTARFEQGLVRLGYETIPGEHPIKPVLVRDTAKTAALVAHLRANGILATGLNHPIVPKGDETIRFQISADHTATDIDEALAVLASFPLR